MSNTIDTPAYATGILSFFSWAEPLWRKNQLSIGRDQHVISISGDLSKRFILGVAKGDDVPFIGIQEREFVWFKLIPWQEILFARNSERIVFTTNNVEKLPGMAIALQAESPEKLSSISKFEMLRLRRIEISGAGDLVSLDDPFATLKSTLLPSYNDLTETIRGRFSGYQHRHRGMK